MQVGVVVVGVQTVLVVAVQVVLVVVFGDWLWLGSDGWDTQWWWVAGEVLRVVWLWFLKWQGVGSDAANGSGVGGSGSVLTVRMVAVVSSSNTSDGDSTHD